MKISDLERLDHLECLQKSYDDIELSAGYTSDLLSDVMAHADEGSVLITIQAHKNTIAVASLVGIAAIVFCNDRPVSEEVLEAAKEEGVAVFSTSDSQFVASALIAQELEGASA